MEIRFEHYTKLHAGAVAEMLALDQDNRHLFCRLLNDLPKYIQRELEIKE